MKKALLIFLISSATIAVAQKNDFLVTMDGIGEIKIGMNQTELEKLLGQKMIMKNALDSNAVSYQDSVRVKYKRADMTLFFQRQYTENNSFFMYLIGLRTNGPLTKTANGIGIGSDKLRIISAYDTSRIVMGPGYEGEENAIKSKTTYRISVGNEEWDREIIFYLINKKVISIEVGTIFNDSE